MRFLNAVVLLAAALAGCADNQTITNSTAPDGLHDRGRADAATNGGDLRSGGVFVMTNQPTGNAIAAYFRASDGTLTLAGMFPTGGAGAGGGPDPLRSQGSLILSSQNHDDNQGSAQLLFVVNAGSSDISVLAVEKDSLKLVSRVSSGGVRPTSLTLNEKRLHVLNAGSGTITGFTIDGGGQPTPIPGSTRTVTGGTAGDPSEVSFSPDGRLLVVTGKTFNNIDTYVVNDGVPSGPIPNHSAGPTPFGFAFDNTQHLVIAEAFALVPGGAAASSYSANRDGVLSVVSPSVHDGQSAACWLVISTNGRFAYVTNTNSSDISSYAVSPSGNLALLDPVVATTDPGSNPIDMAFTAGSRFLFVVNNTTGTVDGFAVGGDGSLTRVSSIGGLPPNAAGIAAN
jgi:6-phosphogluconolactonase